MARGAGGRAAVVAKTAPKLVANLTKVVEAAAAEVQRAVAVGEVGVAVEERAFLLKLLSERTLQERVQSQKADPKCPQSFAGAMPAWMPLPRKAMVQNRS